MFYNEKKQVLNLDINDSLIIGSGFYSNVYKINQDTCFKHYKIYPERYTEELLKYLKTLDFNSLYKIYDLVYHNDKLDGYLMKYYQSIDLKDKPISYLYESYMEAIKLFHELSKDRILLYDMHEFNLIPTDDLVVLIDCDNRFKAYSYDDAFDENKRFFCIALGSLVASKFDVCMKYRQSISSYIATCLMKNPKELKSNALIKTIGVNYV